MGPRPFTYILSFMILFICSFVISMCIYLVPITDRALYQGPGHYTDQVSVLKELESWPRFPELGQGPCWAEEVRVGPSHHGLRQSSR